MLVLILVLVVEVLVLVVEVLVELVLVLVVLVLVELDVVVVNLACGNVSSIDPVLVYLYIGFIAVGFFYPLSKKL